MSNVRHGPSRLRRPRWHIAVAAVVAAGAVLLTGAPAAAAEPQSARDWSRDVCTAVDRWTVAVDAAADALSFQPSAGVEGATEVLDDFVGATDKATTKLVQRVREAGRPLVSGGREIASSLKRGLVELRAAVRTAVSLLTDAPIDDVTALGLAAITVEEAIRSAVRNVASAFDETGAFGVKKLANAMRSEPACEGIV